MAKSRIVLLLLLLFPPHSLPHRSLHHHASLKQATQQNYQEGERSHGKRLSTTIEKTLEQVYQRWQPLEAKSARSSRPFVRADIFKRSGKPLSLAEFKEIAWYLAKTAEPSKSRDPSAKARGASVTSILNYVSLVRTLYRQRRGQKTALSPEDRWQLTQFIMSSLKEECDLYTGGRIKYCDNSFDLHILEEQLWSHDDLENASLPSEHRLALSFAMKFPAISGSRPGNQCKPPSTYPLPNTTMPPWVTPGSS
ncbi:hypothetical protein I350_06787 [Cryptococcus amylolentus CBS 6273]|uniref:Uncharacterized protein n=1 Tax=Cryptococcus amylolentus CBS 6273 TaxID=1296118 RepID=A0A1E3JJP9_9TREE|nr:hypothetical protein I350_06787 [Cryptococcus amylolentus CBS 6273]